MKSIRFITPKDAAFGFGMAGIEQRTTTPDKAEEALLKAIADDGIGLVALDERLLGSIPAETMDMAEKRWQGILVVLPAPTGSTIESDYVNQLVSRAIGYHVRFD